METFPSAFDQNFPAHSGISSNVPPTSWNTSSLPHITGGVYQAPIPILEPENPSSTTAGLLSGGPYVIIHLSEYLGEWVYVAILHGQV